MAEPPDYEVRVIGAEKTPLRDAYHLFLRLPWHWAIALIVAAWLALNALFAAAYWRAGGIANARPGSYEDAFYFSVQTMGTIGYGSMSPQGRAANILVVVESVVGLLVLALATGLVFTKFARSTARVRFARDAVITPMDGVPTLMLRLGNVRGNRIVDTRIRVVLTRTERTREGNTMYRMYDLKLVRDRAPQLTRSWTVMHTIDADSPLAGSGAAELAAAEVELMVTLVGLDDTSTQTVHASHQYLHRHIKWGMRHVDILSETADGNLLLDLRRFDEVEPTERVSAGDRR
jgi:inward rectifier potassium channel